MGNQLQFNKICRFQQRSWEESNSEIELHRLQKILLALQRGMQWSTKIIKSFDINSFPLICLNRNALTELFHCQTINYFRIRKLVVQPQTDSFTIGLVFSWLSREFPFIDKKFQSPLNAGPSSLERLHPLETWNFFLKLMMQAFLTTFVRPYLFKLFTHFG